MKILIASTYIPPVAGGAERVVWETAKRLSKKHEVHILTTGKREMYKREGIFIHSLPQVSSYILHYSTFGKRAIKKMFDEMEFDILHCHIAGPWGWVLPEIVKHKKFIVTCHGSDVYPKKMKSKIIIKPILKSADVVVCVSKWMRDYVNEKYKINSFYIPNGFDTRFKKMNIKRKKNMILYIGRLIERKGIRELLAAADKLKEHDFYFAGKGHLSKKIIHNNTKYLGFVEDEEIPVLYNKATICVLPSYFEGLPLVGIEAMACGCSIIATKTLGFSELIENKKTGILIKPCSVQEIIDSIKYLMKNHKKREEIGKNAHIESKKYSWDEITKKYESFYYKTLENKKKTKTRFSKLGLK